MYIIQKQFISNNDQIWVNALDKNENNYQYDFLVDANNQAKQLEKNDIEGKKYKIIEV